MDESFNASGPNGDKIVMDFDRRKFLPDEVQDA
jgi:hypothetical protein